ncbi:glycosyltransferase [Photobacterium toruni]|uniref:GalNAc-alpha-(1->4)-GalNAc-alpha-(1->3)-diNAcBac-PP-undecaprenol alpha-1,4-N-acetyl-D-galactosaminyltransferase n=1 Tax=Photobacterium toruni TaxID=1935446 RepID=A0A1T4N8L6_9GAMM|nr:glycosyltransferase [Photobacterium toruni]SJZ75463.1 GalNAc-alpha-(1->4)-GalNAc-alpha-(1->3)-diNAcBac-PP-undecaprenol alpha-1,4-N-acetyl-D-galactosaminyltransferase [Photobacterium toruni]
MNICITTKTLGRGGSEILLSYIIPKLILFGHNIEVVYFHKMDNDISNLLESYGAKVIYLGPLNKISLISTLIRYWKYLRNNNAILFEHSPLVSFFSRILARKNKIVYVEHSVFENYNRVTRFLNKITYKLVDQIICCSDKVYSSNGNIGIVLKNAVEIRNKKSFLQPDDLSFPDYKIIISVANVSKVKNHEMLINAFNKVRYEKVKLLIVGDARDNIDQLLRAISLSDKRGDIIYYGPSSDVFPLLSIADIFCLTSIHEGLPISILEAMSLGLVPVSTNVGGIPELLDEKCGFITEVNDTNSYANKLDLLLSNDFLYNEYSSNSKNKIKEQYNLDSYCERINSIFLNYKENRV